MGLLAARLACLAGRGLGEATEFDLAGFAQGAGLIFISANDYHRSIFTVELKSGHITKTGKTRNSGKIFPLISFCTPGTS